VLLGCRRHEGTLSIEVWDTGIGIRTEELREIFEEFHQVDNAARERSRGLGLGLSIVQRLGNLLGHRIRVRSQPGRGSMFAIDVMLPSDGATSQAVPDWHSVNEGPIAGVRHSGTILAVEDDPEVRELLEIFLKSEGYHTTTASDGVAALELVTRGTILPDLVLA
jgi:two-component system CheB/CheR fusion protein